MGKSKEQEHLEQAARQLGKTLEDLEMPPFPDIASHIWATFLELHEGRTYGMSGPNPISYDIIKSWCDLTLINLKPWEVEIIKSLDNLWIKTLNEENDG